MSVWLTERDIRADRTGSARMTLNVAFLQEIKQDQVELQAILKEIRAQLSDCRTPGQRRLAESFGQLRDELETYFALEEFYGYFQSAQMTHSRISSRAGSLKSEHERLFLHVCDLVELAESLVYREVSPAKALPAMTRRYDEFLRDFKQHEQQEMELMLALCNEDIGVGD